MIVVNIRRASPVDADDIVAGIDTICAEGGAFYTRRFIPSLTWQRVLNQPELTPNHLLAVFEWSGQFAGCGRLFPHPEHTLMHHVAELGMFLLPAYRGQGNGRLLLNWMLDWASTQPIEKITLQVFATNVPALNLYQSAGFKEEGRLYKQLKQGDTYIDFVQMAYWL